MSEKRAVLTVAANDDEIDAIGEFLDNLLEDVPVSAETRAQLDMAVEEIFVNISHYAYGEGTGEVTVRGGVTAEPPHTEGPSGLAHTGAANSLRSQAAPITVTLSFEDEGVAFNPLDRKPPDLTPAVRRRQIGGLGIFLARSMSDEIGYERKDGKNILTIKKKMV